MTLGHNDRRFGFSVVGGLEEGFPPRIDEIAPGTNSNSFSSLFNWISDDVFLFLFLLLYPSILPYRLHGIPSTFSTKWISINAIHRLSPPLRISAIFFCVTSFKCQLIICSLYRKFSFHLIFFPPSVNDFAGGKGCRPGWVAMVEKDKAHWIWFYIVSVCSTLEREKDMRENQRGEERRVGS